MHNDPVLKLDSTEISNLEEHKFHLIQQTPDYKIL